MGETQLEDVYSVSNREAEGAALTRIEPWVGVSVRAFGPGNTFIGRTFICGAAYAALAMGSVWAQSNGLRTVETQSEHRATADAGTPVAVGASADTLKPETPRLEPDPQALEAEVGSVSVEQLEAMQPSAVSDQQSGNANPKPGSLDSGLRPSLGMTIQSAQPGTTVPHDSSANSNAAWRQDAASEGGNFTPDYEAVKSAQELDEKIGKEQAKEAAAERSAISHQPSGNPTANSNPRSLDSSAQADWLGMTNQTAEGSKQKIERKYDVRFIGERGIGGGMNFFSIDKEIKMGKEMAQEIDAQVKFLDDPAVNEYVNRLAQNLMRNSDAKVPLRVRIIDSDELNAFALPGGFFYINTGMLLATEDEAELAGVMAHEIGHIAARHATKNATKQQIWNFASIPLMFIGGPAGMIVRNVAQVALPMSMMKFSRNAEREADLLGIEYEYAAGYDPGAMVNFFERLQSNDKKKPNFVVRAFQTHPMTDDRLKRAQKEIADMLPPQKEYLVTSSEFEAMKERLAILTSNRLGVTPVDKKTPSLKSGKFSF